MMILQSGQGVHERDICNHMVGCKVRVVVEVPVYLGGFGSAGCKEKDRNLAAERIDTAADEFLQNFRTVFLVPLHETTEQVATEGARRRHLPHCCRKRTSRQC
jgi:hypothetical protein